ncbi:DMT family transporter [Acidithrix ferrooxidans]|uniref:O-acetylserine/cysteine export protein n=1 Tax=Acidithrix ferrooxidans TaxID=1280514 RepID=A0A0D8HJ33_9ACTN|nr:DMT family transporter [Acidithrix ferrooxidans]KJF17797.1 O-acetylserine/cysteine export protein [Acidithrix ferrooxidans]
MNVKHATTKNSPGGVLAASYAVAVWGYGNVLARMIPISGPLLSVLRMSLGAIIAIAMAYSTRRKLTVRILKLGLWGGVAFGLNSLFFFSAVKYTSPTTATVIGALQPALLMTVSGRLFGEKVTTKTIFGSIVAIAATALVVFGAPRSGHDSLFGDFLALLALVTYALYFIFSKQARLKIDTIEYQAGMQISAALVVLPFGIFLGGASSITIHSLYLVAILTIIPGSGHFFINWAHSHLELTLASILTLSTPIVTMIFAWILLGDKVNLNQIIGTAIAIGALVFVVVDGTNQKPKIDTSLN